MSLEKPQQIPEKEPLDEQVIKKIMGSEASLLASVCGLNPESGLEQFCDVGKKAFGVVVRRHMDIPERNMMQVDLLLKY